MILICGRNLCTRAVSSTTPIFVNGSIRKLEFKNSLSSRTHVRFLSTKDVFGRADYSNIDIPPIPTPPLPKPTIDELVSSGKSVLSELGLFQWYSPPSYLRVFMEWIHSVHLPVLDIDIPWWTAIALVTAAIRLSTFPLVRLGRRNAALTIEHKDELKAYEERGKIARAEGNNLLTQQIVLEQQDFMRRKGIKAYKQILVSFGNGLVFFCQYRAVRLLADSNYPGFTTGGALWFVDLTAQDFILPVIASVLWHLAIRTGLETGSARTNIWMKLFLLYGVPAILMGGNYGFMFFNFHIPTAVWIHICASSSVTLMYAAALASPALCKILKVPHIKADKGAKNELQELMEWFKERKTKAKTTVSPSSLRMQDMKEFESAGRAKPIIKK